MGYHGIRWASTEASLGLIPVPEIGAKPSAGPLTALKLKDLLPTAPFAAGAGNSVSILENAGTGSQASAFRLHGAHPPPPSSKEAIMTKTLMLGTALSALLLSGAFARRRMAQVLQRAHRRLRLVR